MRGRRPQGSWKVAHGIEETRSCLLCSRCLPALGQAEESNAGSCTVLQQLCFGLVEQAACVDGSAFPGV